MARLDRLTILALRTLEDAAAQAHYGPIDRQWGHRLALSLLVHRKAAHDWQAQKFWELLSDPGATLCNHEHASATRLISMHMLLDRWHDAVLSTRPDDKRREWIHRYAGKVDSSVIDDIPVAMCNRSERGDVQHIRRLFGAEVVREFNEGPKILYPKAPGPVVRMKDGALVVDQMTWGFPVTLTGRKGQKLKPKPVNNARFDKLGTFWKRWASVPNHRCLIPTARYAEAVGEAGHMTETWLSVKDQPIFAWAGLWSESDEWGHVYTGVMTDNAPELAHIHDRSPLIIDPVDWMTWLTAPLADLYHFDQPYPARFMTVEATDVPWYQRSAPMPGPLL